MIPTLRRTLSTPLVACLLATALSAPLAAQQAATARATADPSAAVYVPPPGEWERREPAELGFDPELLDEAIAFAQASETSDPADMLENHLRAFAREPFGEAIGPFRTRGPQTGVIVKDGYIVAEWGDPARVDMTHSVTKSFLSTTVGLAWAEGLIRSIDDPVGPYLPPILLPPGDGEPGRESGTGFATAIGGDRLVTLFDSEHNRQITWDHLLRQTSNWAGTLWGKPDWSDRPDRDPDAWLATERAAPGTRFEYNDTRVNLLALAATLAWREPIQKVLRERVMRPIGASPTWHWHGYENSWIILDGSRVQVPSGGGHWGGGMFINAYDQARLGLLTTRQYRWGHHQVLPVEWWEMATTPGPANPGYGFMNFFLNTDRERYPAAPETAWAHIGSGQNMVYCDPEHDLVIVARWIRGGQAPEIVEKVLASLESGNRE